MKSEKKAFDLYHYIRKHQSDFSSATPAASEIEMKMMVAGFNDGFGKSDYRKAERLCKHL